MADHVLERRLWLPRPRAVVFAFFVDPQNLVRVNPPATRFRWLAPPPVTLTTGSVLDFSIRLAGVRVRWRVLVRELDPPYRFVDAQLWGPFGRWEHRHRFVEAPLTEGGPGPLGTWVEDRVTYRLPLGTLGRLVHDAGVGRRIARLFEYREQRLRALLGSPPAGRE